MGVLRQDAGIIKALTQVGFSGERASETERHERHPQGAPHATMAEDEGTRKGPRTTPCRPCLYNEPTSY